MPLLLPKHAKTVSKTVDPGVRSLPIPQLGTKILPQIFSLHLLDRVAMPFFGPKHSKKVPNRRSGSPVLETYCLTVGVGYRNF